MTKSIQERAVVGVYATHTAAELAIKALQEAGIDMKKLSIIGRNYQTEEHAVGFYTAGDRMRFWGGHGAFWGSLWGMLAGGPLFCIPGVGPLVAMGPVVGWIAGALQGAVLGGSIGVFGAVLSGVGVAEDQIVKYETEVKAGKFLVLARSSVEEIERAHAILETTGALHLTARAV